MAKPIFIVEAPDLQTQEDLVNTQKVLENKLNDYHVLVVQTNVNDFNFNVFYDKDFTEINYDELRKLIKEKLKQLLKLYDVIKCFNTVNLNKLINKNTIKQF